MHPSFPAMISNIGQIAITVSDLDKAIRFYRDVLGLPFLFQAPPAMAFFKCGSVRLMLSLPETPGTKPANSIIYFKVEDIEAAAAMLVARGTAINGGIKLIAKMPDHDLWMAEFHDPDDNALVLMCEKPNASAALS